MEDALLVSRLQFAFTVTYHYLFPMLTMGLALLIFVLKSVYMRNRNEPYNNSARFWGKIFAVTFVMGVVTGIPLEFQFGTNWAAFSEYAGDIIAQTLAMEGAFAFFLESAFVGLFLWGEDRFGQRVHWFSSLMVFLGTWASGYFIITTNAWVQHPVGYRVLENGNIELDNYLAVLLNSWMWPQYAHNMGGAVVCGAFVMAGLGAFYVLGRRHEEYGRIFLKVGVIAGALASLWMLWILMLAIPFPFIANTAGWFTAELGRQPWLAYGLFRTSEGVSPLVSSGSVLFTLIGFAGMYLIMGLLYVVLMVREVAHGPEDGGDVLESPESLTA